MTTENTSTPAELNDEALNQLSGGHGGAGAFIAGAAIGGILGGIAEAVSPHTVVFGQQAPQYYAPPAQVYVQQPQPVYVQQPQPVIVQQPTYVQQPAYVQQPTYYAQPGPIVINTGW